MLFGLNQSILKQLILIIAGISILSAIASTIAHYSYTAKLIEDSIEQQMASSLELMTDYLEKNYSEKLRYDLNLLDSSREVNQFLGSSIHEYIIHQQNVEKLFLSFAKNRETLYHSIRLIDVSGNELAIIENKRRVRNYNTLIIPPLTQKNLALNEVFLNLKSSEAGTILFSGPAFDDGEVYFAVGIAKTDPDIGGFGGAIIITFTLKALYEYLNNFKVLDYSIAWFYTHTGELIYSASDDKSIDLIPFIFNQQPLPENLLIYSSEPKAKDSIQSIIKTVVILPIEAREQLLKKLLAVTLLILFSIAMVALIIAPLMSKRIIQPISRLTDLSKKIAEGDFSVNMPVKGDDELTSLSRSFNRMIEELKEQRHELKSLANKDLLTQLPNRRQFEEHLSKIINFCRRQSQQIALLYIDLDQFKDTNDSFGHPAGDKLIQEVAKRLTNTVRESDLVARLGGDEFAIILHPHKARKYTETVAQKILEELAKPFDIGEHQIFSGGSIGISIYPRDGENSTEIVKNADAAMYEAKQAGRNNYQFYYKDLSERSNERIFLGSLIRNALDTDDLFVYFQPKVSMITNNIIGAEALLRWSNDDKQDIEAAKIIDVAESSGFIDKVDTWVINQVLKHMQTWERSNNISLVPISINVSGKLLEQNKIINIIKQSLNLYNIDPRHIEIEITENHLIRNFTQTEKILTFLHDMGIKLAIDDFGTGYSSLSYLKDIAADTLKIDRKFIVNTMKSDSDKAIATAMIKLASSLDMEVVVEGVETKEQVELFKKLGAHAAQGFYYSKPLSAEKFSKLLTGVNTRKIAF